MTTEGKSHTACKLLTLFINANNEMLSLFWFHIRRIPHHIINFQSLVITFHWSHLTLLCWGTLVLAGCCLCYRLLVLGVPVLAPLAQQWLRLKREERGGAHISPHTGSRRPNPTRPDTGALNKNKLIPNIYQSLRKLTNTSWAIVKSNTFEQMTEIA